MDAFPAFYPLAGRTVVIAGPGEAAEAKARLFAGSPAVIVRLSGAEAPGPEAFRGAALAFIASDDAVYLEAAAAAARSAGVPVNVVDRPELCDFITPAVIDRGAVVAAVSSSGAAPLLAASLRSDIEALLPEGVGHLAELFDKLRDEIRRALPDLPRRRAFLRAAIDGPAAKAALAGDRDAARGRLLEALANAQRPLGRLAVISGDGPADLLSLRAARALGQADMVVVDPDAAPGVIGLIRRDARRLSIDEASPDSLAAGAAEGLQVVWLAVAPLDPSILQVVVEAGVAIEILANAPG